MATMVRRLRRRKRMESRPVVIPACKRVRKLMSGAGILPVSDANCGGNAWFPASPEHGRDARATRFSNFFTSSCAGMTKGCVRPLWERGDPRIGIRDKIREET
jgi:hypothetical protein